jgi:hypothetical protein
MLERHIRTLSVAVVVTALLAVAVPAAAGQSVERPIEENLSGYTIGMVYSPSFPGGDTFDGRCSQPSQWVSTSAGSGVISHLGRVSWTTEHCFQLFAGTFGDAELVITAANGDQLFGTYDGVMTGETSFAESLVITGGTGRFAGASGTIEESGWFDPGTGYMEIDGIGSISYDASDRASND